MLLSLSIKNIVLVDSLNIPFEAGFSVLTGETGAGKSILLDALNLALGNRAEARLVRSGEKQGEVSAEFFIKNNKQIKPILDEQGIEAEDNLILRRVVYADGKSKAFINDSPVSLNLINQVAENLVEYHGQHDQRGLLNSANHIKILDSFGSLGNESASIGKVFHKWKEIESDLAETRAAVAKARADEEYLRHVYDELVKLSPEDGEEEKLAEQRTMMMNRGKIIEALKAALNELSDEVDVTDAIRKAERVLDRNSAQSGGKFITALAALERAGNEVSEAIAAIEKTASEVEMDEATLESVEERLFSLRAASRKYGKPVGDLSAYAKEVAGQINLIESQDEKLAALEKAAEISKKKYSILASELSKKRSASAKKLEKSVEAELAPLKMAGSKFKVKVEDLPEEQWRESGIDKVAFEVSTNPGAPFGPISKIASGGELSRFMLALKVALSDVNSIPTLIFDEIDTGIGGAVADAVGKRLSKLAKNFQVMCVTHQPQVASYGQHHMRVEKSGKGGQVITKLKILSDVERKEEIARMLAGASVTDEARAAALKLMSN